MKFESGEGWGSDTKISMPAAREGAALVELDSAWVFTAQGLRHNITEAEREDLFFPTYVPEGWRL